MRGTVSIAACPRAPSTTSPLRNLRLTINRDQPIGNGRYHRESTAITGQTREWRKLGRSRKRDHHRSVGNGRKTICRHEPLEPGPFSRPVFPRFPPRQAERSAGASRPGAPRLGREAGASRRGAPGSAISRGEGHWGERFDSGASPQRLRHGPRRTALLLDAGLQALLGVGVRLCAGGGRQWLVALRFPPEGSASSRRRCCAHRALGLGGGYTAACAL